MSYGEEFMVVAVFYCLDSLFMSGMTIKNLLETTRWDENALDGGSGALRAPAEWLYPHSWTSGFPSVKWEVGEHGPLQSPCDLWQLESKQTK